MYEKVLCSVLSNLEHHRLCFILMEASTYAVEPKMNDEAMVKANTSIGYIWISIHFLLIVYKNSLLHRHSTPSYLNVPMCNMVDVLVSCKMYGYVCLVDNAYMHTSMM